MRNMCVYIYDRALNRVYLIGQCSVVDRGANKAVFHAGQNVNIL